MSELRILGGTAKGRRLQIPDSARPTGARVRKSLFDILETRYGQGSSFLDLYAGAGGVGLEAASRGYAVTMVEKDAKAVQTLERNARELHLTATIKRADALVFMARATSFDIVFIDPPYNHDILEIARTAVSRPELIAPGGALIVQSPGSGCAARDCPRIPHRAARVRLERAEFRLAFGVEQHAKSIVLKAVRLEIRALPCASKNRVLHSFSSGAVAQLGARLNGIQKVKGSNPFSSTRRKDVRDAILENRVPPLLPRNPLAAATVLLPEPNSFVVIQGEPGFTPRFRRFRLRRPHHFPPRSCSSVASCSCRSSPRRSGLTTRASPRRARPRRCAGTRPP